jgi:hypothetical protein
MDDGFDGFPPVDEFHCLESFEAVCRALALLARDRERLAELETRSRITAQLARRRMELGFRRLAAAISRLPSSILFLTDYPVFEEGNVQVERLAQWCQLCTGVASTVVGYLGAGAPEAPRPELTDVEIVAMGEVAGTMDDAFAAWNELERRRSISEIIISIDGEAGPRLAQNAGARCKYVTLDTWRAALANAAIQQSAAPTPDYWPVFDRNGANVLLSTTALRYAPRILDTWKAQRPEGTIVILCGLDESDKDGLDLLLTVMTGLEPGSVVTLSASPGAPYERHFFDRLRACRRPAVILAIGADTQAVRICEALGTCFSAPCLPVSAARFPVLTVRKDGSPSLCETYAEFARNSADPIVLARSVPTHREDTGWSTYKESLTRRLAGQEP